MEPQQDEGHQSANASASSQPEQKTAQGRRYQRYIAPMSHEERMQLKEFLMLEQGFKENCVSHDTFAHSDREQLLNLAQISASPDTSDEPCFDEANDACGASSGFKYNSACPPSFESACATLGIDKLNLAYPLESQRTVCLKAWQITGCAWMIDQEDGPIKGGMLTDACGTGKTLTVLTTIYHQAARSGGQPMKPTLIVCPPTVIETWMGEIDRFFKDEFRVFVFLGRSKYNQKKWKDHIISTDEDLRHEILKSDQNGPVTGRTIVITSYQTWLGRTCSKILPKDDGKSNATSPVPDTDVLLSNNRHTSKAKRRTKKYSTEMTGTFDRVVCDEANEVKNVHSGAHQSIALLKAPHIWLVTATPVWNRAIDMVGYLSLLRRPSFDQNNFLEDTIDDMADTRPRDSSHSEIISQTSTIEAYRAYEYVQFTPGMDLPTHLLSPRSVERLAQSPEGWTKFGSYVLPVVSAMISLSRKIGDHVHIGQDREDIVVGGEIPPVNVLTVDLRFLKKHQIQHNEIYARYADKLVNVTPDIAAEGSMSTIPEKLGFRYLGVERMLRLAAFSPCLHDFVEDTEKGHNYHPGNLNPESKEIFGTVAGLGESFSKYWNATVQDKSSTVPSSADGIAKYLAQSSPKLRYLLQIFADEGTLSKLRARDTPRFLIFCMNPFVLWQVEMFLAALGMEYNAIRSGAAMETKFKMSSDFNTPTDTARVTLTTFKRGSLGLNFHVGCSRVIILETPGTLGMIRQVIGRVHRIGQQEEQKVWILFQNHTIERWIEHSLACKAIPELVAAIGARKQQTDNADANTQEGLREYGNIQAKVADGLRRMLGQSESRLKYNNPLDLGDRRFDGGGLDLSGHDAKNAEGDNPVDTDMPDCEGEVHQDAINIGGSPASKA